MSPTFRAYSNRVPKNGPSPDELFVEHAKWLAFERNSLQWPKYWRAVIFKIERRDDILTGTTTYMVLPRNPEYQKYVDETEKDCMVYGGVFRQPPPMYLEAAKFDSIEEVDRWAQVAWRISQS
jgi:hypothetical protein